MKNVIQLRPPRQEEGNTSPAQVDPPAPFDNLSEREVELIESAAARVLFSVAAEINKLGISPTKPDETTALALDLSFVHEVVIATILRQMNFDHPLQPLIDECLSEMET